MPSPAHADNVLSRLSAKVHHLQEELTQQQTSQQEKQCWFDRSMEAVHKRLEELERKVAQIHHASDSDGAQPHCDGEHKQCSSDLEHAFAELVPTETVDMCTAANDQALESATSVKNVEHKRCSLSLEKLESLVAHTRPFDSSVWEVASMIGTGCLTCATSGLLIAIMMLTVFVQATYVYIGGTIFHKDWFNRKKH